MPLPKQIADRRSTVWKLLCLPYGVVEAGRQWLCAIRVWILRAYKGERVAGVEQIFYKKGEHGWIVLLITKVVEDFLIVGTDSAVLDFLYHLDTRFKPGQIGRGSTLKFLGCHLTTTKDGDTEISMKDYLKQIQPIPLSKSRRNETSDKDDSSEIHAIRSLADTMLYLGQAILPQAYMTASKMQQRLGSLHVSNILEANCMVREFRRFRPTILFRKPSTVKVASILTFSDSFHSGTREVYSQSCILTGLKVEASHGVTFHPIIWASHKQKMTSYSSYEAEILAALDADDRRYLLKKALHEQFTERELKHELLVDSK